MTCLTLDIICILATAEEDAINKVPEVSEHNTTLDKGKRNCTLNLTSRRVNERRQTTNIEHDVLKEPSRLLRKVCTADLKGHVYKNDVPVFNGTSSTPNNNNSTTILTTTEESLTSKEPDSIGGTHKIHLGKLYVFCILLICIFLLFVRFLCSVHLKYIVICTSRTTNFNIIWKP